MDGIRIQWIVCGGVNDLPHLRETHYRQGRDGALSAMRGGEHRGQDDAAVRATVRAQWMPEPDLDREGNRTAEANGKLTKKVLGPLVRHPAHIVEDQLGIRIIAGA